MDYEVKLEIFEGPLDLLLHLIHKNEVDIFDIPIAVIAEQYLEYLELMKALNINVAGDFLVMASTLIHIKSRMLLPELNEGEEEEDPRLEITRPLLEYMRFKEAATELLEKDILDRDVFIRNVPSDLQTKINEGEPRVEANLFQLIDAFKRVIEKKVPGAKLSFQAERWSVKERTEFIIAHLKKNGPLFFKDLFRKDNTLSELIVTFLALLELVHRGLIQVFQAVPESDIRLIPCFDKVGGNDHGNIH